jgi:hypothetical protein
MEELPGLTSEYPQSIHLSLKKVGDQSKIFLMFCLLLPKQLLKKTGYLVPMPQVMIIRLTPGWGSTWVDNKAFVAHF